MTLRQVLIILATVSSALPRTIFFRPHNKWKNHIEENKTSPFTSAWNIYGTEDETSASSLLRVSPDVLPVEANGDKELVSRLLKLPIKYQPIWLVGWQISKKNKKKVRKYTSKFNATKNKVITTTKNIKVVGFKPAFDILQTDASMYRKYVATLSPEHSSTEKSSKENYVRTKSSSTTPIYSTKKSSKENYISTKSSSTTPIYYISTKSDSDLKDIFQNIIGQTKKFSEEEIYTDGDVDKELHINLNNDKNNSQIVDFISALSKKRATDDYLEVYDEIEKSTDTHSQFLKVEGLGTTQMPYALNLHETEGNIESLESAPYLSNFTNLLDKVRNKNEPQIERNEKDSKKVLSLETARIKKLKKEDYFVPVMIPSPNTVVTVLTPILKTNSSKKYNMIDNQSRYGSFINLVTVSGVKPIAEDKNLDNTFPNAYKDYQQVLTTHKPDSLETTFSSIFSRISDFNPFQKLINLVKREGKEKNFPRPFGKFFVQTNPKLAINDVDTSYIDISDFKTTDSGESNEGPGTHEFMSLLNPAADEKGDNFPRPFKINWGDQETTENPLFPNAMPVKSSDNQYRLPYQKLNWFNNPTTLESSYQISEKASESPNAEDEAILFTHPGDISITSSGVSTHYFPYHNDGTPFPNSPDDDSIYKLPYAYPNAKYEKALLRFTEINQIFDEPINGNIHQQTKATITNKKTEFIEEVTSSELIQTPKMKYYDINEGKSNVPITDFVKKSFLKPMTTQGDKFEKITGNNIEEEPNGKLRFCNILIPNEFTTTSFPTKKKSKGKTRSTTKKENSIEDVDYSLILYNIGRTTIKPTLDPKRVPLMKNSRPIRNDEIGPWHDKDESPQYFDYDVQE